MSRGVVKSISFMSACQNHNICFYFEEDDSTGSLKTRLYDDVSAKRKSIVCLYHMVKKWLRMWKNNKATEPAHINRRIKSTSMASTGRKAKLREKTKVSPTKCCRIASVDTKSLRCVALIHVLRV